MKTTNLKNNLSAIAKNLADEEFMRNAIQEVEEKKIQFKREIQMLAKGLALDEKQSKIHLREMFAKNTKKQRIK